MGEDVPKKSCEKKNYINRFNTIHKNNHRPLSLCVQCFSGDNTGQMTQAEAIDNCHLEQRKSTSIYIALQKYSQMALYIASRCHST